MEKKYFFMSFIILMNIIGCKTPNNNHVSKDEKLKKPNMTNSEKKIIDNIWTNSTEKITFLENQDSQMIFSIVEKKFERNEVLFPVINNVVVIDNKKFYLETDAAPLFEYKGGMSKFIDDNLEYPQFHLPTTMICYLLVSDKGEVMGTGLLKGAGREKKYNTSAINCVNKIKLATPAFNKGKPVASFYYVLVKFRGNPPNQN